MVPFVRGGGKIVLLVSRDLLRLNGACVRLSKDEYSGRKLYRWLGEGCPLERLGDEGWETLVDFAGKPLDEVKDRRDVIHNFWHAAMTQSEYDEWKESQEGAGDPDWHLRRAMEEKSLLWLPLSQPFLVEDGAQGNRNSVLLREIMTMVTWALNTSDDKTIILGGMEAKLPPELQAVTHIIRWDFPSREEIRELVTGEKGNYNIQGIWEQGKYEDGEPCDGKDVKGSLLKVSGLYDEWYEGILDEDIIENMIRASQGLDLEDCRVVILGAIRAARHGVLSDKEIEYVRNKKVQMIGSDGLLTVEDYSKIDEVAGLQKLTRWVRERVDVFKHPQLAKKHGIKVPKGLLLTGVPGCGKSLTAKTIAKEMGLPLLGFDLGNITDSYYGQTEENMHRALKQAEGMAPCVLWIDEFEKMFASAGDGGVQSHEVTQRVNGIFLKWMEEREEGVFVVATSNDLSKIAPEYQRSGRWSGTFFFDLPSLKERIKILETNLNNKEKAPGGHSLDVSNIVMIAKETASWASSDITMLIEVAIQIAFQEGKEIHGEEWKEMVPAEVSFKNLMGALPKIAPMCNSRAGLKQLNRIRRSGEGMNPASDYDIDDVPVKLPKSDEDSEVNNINSFLTALQERENDSGE